MLLKVSPASRQRRIPPWPEGTGLPAPVSVNLSHSRSLLGLTGGISTAWILQD